MSVITLIVQKRWLTLAVMAVLIISTVSYLAVGFEDVDIDEPEDFLKKVELVEAGSFSLEELQITTIGAISSAAQVSVRAESSGRIKYLPVSRGEKVERDYILLEVEHFIEDARVMQAGARVDAALATLDKMRSGDRPENIAILEQQLMAAEQKYYEMQRGARPEEIAIIRTQLDNAERNLGDAERDLENVVLQADRNLETLSQGSFDLLESVQVALDKILSSNLEAIIYPLALSLESRCKLQLVTLTQSLDSDLEQTCKEVVEAFENQRELLDEMSDELETEELISNLVLTKNRLIDMRSFLSRLFASVNTAITVKGESHSVSGALIDSYELLVSSSQTELEAMISQVTGTLESLQNQQVLNKSSIDSAQNRVNQTENTIYSLENELVLKESGATEEALAIQESQVRQLVLQIDIARKGARSEDIRGQQAAVQQARADLSIALINKEKAVTRAPINGTIIDFPFKFGDYVSAGTEVAVLADMKQLELSTYITEKDLPYIELFGEVSLQDSWARGLITEISPALSRETKKIEVLVSFYEGFEDLLLGQTVFVNFEPEINEEVLLVPLTAVRIIEGEANVFTIDEDGVVFELPVLVESVFGDMIEVTELDSKQLIISDVSGVEVGEEVDYE